MQRRFFLAIASGLPFLLSGQGAESDLPRLRIVLNPDEAAHSYGEVTGKDGFRFPVGLGRNGITPRGKAFRGGSSLLGEFRINAILSGDRFEMEKSLLQKSGKSESWLRKNLFSNMSSIDFDGDGKGQEYGEAYIGLVPVNSTATQPFYFGDYKGTFRWYSYAIHGTQDQSRIGTRSTGGCINAGKADLRKIVDAVKIGDPVLIAEANTLPGK